MKYSKLFNYKLSSNVKSATGTDFALLDVCKQLQTSNAWGIIIKNTMGILFINKFIIHIPLSCNAAEGATTRIWIVEYACILSALFSFTGCSIISGFALPRREEHKEFLLKVL